ncbi:porin [Pseudidiomarina gelatinasegens]|jgi:predicted porin|uniref:porin n=1 Tax=Pseudidiomarina gelatinasegens TaxID=2487740 RepID=UPI003A96D038
MKNKLFLTSAIAAAVALSAQPAFAEDQPLAWDIYGKINVSLQSNDLDDGNGSQTDMVSNSSRFGIQGGTQLNDDLEVIYKLEWQVDLADLGGSDNLKSRNQYIGLKGNFGEITIGRRDTVLKTIQGDIDVFSDYEADVKNIFEGENRLNSSVSYYSPAFNHVRFALSYIASDDPLVDDGISTGVSYGDEGLDDTSFYLGAAIDREVDGYDIERLVGYTKVSEAVVGLMWQQQEQVDGTAEADGYVASIKYPYQNFTFKAQYQMMDFSVDGEQKSLAAGVDYKLGKNTKVYSWYTGRDLESIDVNQSYLAIGIEHKF